MKNSTITKELQEHPIIIVVSFLCLVCIIIALIYKHGYKRRSNRKFPVMPEQCISFEELDNDIENNIESDIEKILIILEKPNRLKGEIQ